MWRAAHMVSGRLTTTPSWYQNSPRAGVPLAVHGHQIFLEGGSSIRPCCLDDAHHMVSSYDMSTASIDIGGVLCILIAMTNDKYLRLITPLPPELVAAIDDFRFSERQPSRVAAIRELLAIALRAQGYPPPGAGTAGTGNVAGGRGASSPPPRARAAAPAAASAATNEVIDVVRALQRAARAGGETEARAEPEEGRAVPARRGRSAQ